MEPRRFLGYYDSMSSAATAILATDSSNSMIAVSRRTGRIKTWLAPPQLIQIELSPPPRVPKPQWLRAKAPVGDNFHNLKKLARGLGLHTVCESAQCPNIGECWNHKTATFMLLGDICTRRCGFCAVPKGRPQPIDWEEPGRVAEAVATLGLSMPS